MNWLVSKKWMPYLLLALATALVWGQSVKFEFVWDDQFFIQELYSVRSLNHVPEMFYKVEAQASRPYDFNLFRPIRTAVYALLCFAGGKSEPQPWLYHLANVTGHAATAMMLFAAAGRLLRRCGSLPENRAQIWALGVALAFAVHPVMSEVVCWAKSLDDILAAGFTLAALREVLQPAENRLARWRGLIWYTLAVYSKESAVPFVLILPVLFIEIDGDSWRQAIRRTMPFLLAAIIYIVHRRLVTGRMSQIAPISGSYGQTLVDMLPVPLTYFRLLFGVPPFCIDYSYLHGGAAFLSGPVLAGLLLLAALTTAGLLAWRSERFRVVGFGLAWTGLFLLPVSNLVPMMQYLAERFLYLPLIGWLLALAGLLSTLGRQRIIQVSWLCAVLLWGILAWNRSWIWQDSVTLFICSSQDGHLTPRVRQNAVAAIFELPLIKRYFKSENGHNTLLGQPDPVAAEQLERIFQETLRIFPDEPRLTSALAMTLATTGKPEPAVPLFANVARQEPQSVNAWLNLARAAQQAGQLATSLASAEKVLTLDPDNPNALALVFTCQWQNEQFAAALATARHWHQVAPGDASTDALAKATQKSSPVIRQSP